MFAQWLVKGGAGYLLTLTQDWRVSTEGKREGKGPVLNLVDHLLSFQVLVCRQDLVKVVLPVMAPA